MKCKKYLLVLITLFLIPKIVYATKINYFNVGKDSLTDFENNRTEAEQIVKAVAEEYLYKNYSTDYEQKNADIYAYDYAGNITDSTNNYLNKTFLFRNLNMTPFDISRSNQNNFDCSSFVTNVYLNSFGFDFRDYYSDYYQAFSKSYVAPSYTNDGKISNSSIHYKSCNFDLNSFLYSGRGPSTVGFKYLQEILEKSSGQNQSTNEKLFPYFLENKNGIKKKDLTDLESKFKTGDILLVRRIDKDGKESGHVMIYVKNHITANQELSNGFIHSTGKDLPLADFTKNTTDLGIDKYSVRYITFDKYIDNNFKNTYDKSNDRIITYLAIIRPINIVLNSEYTNAYTNTKVKKTTKNIYNLAKMSYMLDKNSNIYDNYKISMQQYLYNNTQRGYINKTNVVNDGDEISIKAYIKNKGRHTNSVTIKMPYQDNGRLSYVTYGCKSNRNINNTVVEYTRCSADNNITVNKDENNKVITYTIKDLKPGDNANVYYKVQYHSGTNQEKLDIDGMTLYFGEGVNNNQIQFRDLSITGSKNKYTGYSKKASESTIKMINNYYFSGNAKANRDKSLLRMYNEVFKIDLSGILGNLDSKTSTTVDKVMNGIFEYKTTNSQDEDKINGYFYNPKNQQIEKLVVKGLYGGTLVRANIDGERTHQLTFEMLEPGDIVLAFNDANNKKFHSFMFVYGGYKEVINNAQVTKQYILYFRQKNVYVTTNKSLNILKRAIASETYVVLRPSQMYAKTHTVNLNSQRNGIVVNKLYQPFETEFREDFDDETEDGNQEIILAAGEVVENVTLGQEEDMELNTGEVEESNEEITYEEDEDFRQVYAVENTSKNRKILLIIIGVLSTIFGLSLIVKVQLDKKYIKSIKESN